MMLCRTGGFKCIAKIPSRYFDSLHIFEHSLNWCFFSLISSSSPGDIMEMGS